MRFGIAGKHPESMHAAKPEPEVFEGEVVEAEPEPPQKTNKELVIEALTESPKSVEEIQQITELTENAVNVALSKLKANKKAIKLANGQWGLV